MSKTTEVTIAVRSVIENLDDYGIAEGNPEMSVTRYSSTVREDGAALTLSYTDINNGTSYDTDIVIEGDTVTVERRGAIEAVMRFTEGEITETLYRIPPYTFDAVIETKRIRNTLTPTGGTLDLRYHLTIGGAKKSALLKISVER